MPPRGLRPATCKVPYWDWLRRSGQELCCAISIFTHDVPLPYLLCCAVLCPCRRGAVLGPGSGSGGEALCCAASGSNPCRAVPFPFLLCCAHAATGEVLYWDLVEAVEVKRFPAHGGVVTSLTMHPEGTVLATASVDGTIRTWV